MKRTKTILALAPLAVPGPILDLFSVEGGVPDYYRLADEPIQLSIFQPIWLIILLFVITICGGGIKNKNFNLWYYFIIVLAGCSTIVSYLAYGNIGDIYLILASAAFALKLYSYFSINELRKIISYAMVINFATMILNFLIKAFLYNTIDYRLNSFGLNYNSCALIFLLYFILVSKEHSQRGGMLKYWPLIAIALTGSRAAIALSTIPLIFRKYTITTVLIFCSLIMAAYAIFNFRGEDPEDFGSFVPAVTINNSIIENFGLLGRSASILVGLQILQDTFPIGTHSTELSINKFNNYGYPTFAHSSALMILINMGLIGLLVATLIIYHLAKLRTSLVLSGALVAYFVFSGGLITSTKEIVLIWIILFLINNSNFQQPIARSKSAH